MPYSRRNLQGSNSWPSGRNQVCIQRWARLENSPPQNVHFGTPQTNFSGFKKWQAKKKKKKKKKRSCSFSYLSPFIPLPFHFKFFSSPFTSFPSFFSPFSFSLFPFLLFSPFLFSSSFPFSSFPPSKQNFPQTFQGWVPTPSYATDDHYDHESTALPLSCICKIIMSYTMFSLMLKYNIWLIIPMHNMAPLVIIACANNDFHIETKKKCMPYFLLWLNTLNQNIGLPWTGCWFVIYFLKCVIIWQKVCIISGHHPNRYMLSYHERYVPLLKVKIQHRFYDTNAHHGTADNSLHEWTGKYFAIYVQDLVYVLLSATWWVKKSK